MRVVKTKKPGDYFRRENAEEFDLVPGFDWDRFFYHRRTRFNRQFVILFLMISFVLIGFRAREGWVLFITGLVGLSILFFRTRAIAHGLYVARSCPTRARKDHPLEIKYEIRNASEFRVSRFWIRDFFSGSKLGGFSFAFDGDLPALSIKKIEKELICDAGMGMREWSPLILTISDPLGIFEFTVKDDEALRVEILPEYLDLEGFEILDSLDSNAIGMNESVRAGHSPNFLGLREYVAGDSIKRINWKVSARHQELVVNVFESMVHTDLTVCVDMGGENHVGRAGDSTWESAKEATIAILHEMYPRTHRTQLHSQVAAVPFDRGMSHLLLMTQTVADLAPLRSEKSGIDLLRGLTPHLPYGSSLVYVAPLYQNDPLQLARTFAILQERAIRCVAIFVQAPEFVQDLPAGLTRHAVAENNRTAGLNRRALLQANGQIEVQTYLLVRSRSLARSLSKPVIG